MAHVCLKE
jgi:hypothetical protein